MAKWKPPNDDQSNLTIWFLIDDYLCEAHPYSPVDKIECHDNIMTHIQGKGLTAPEQGNRLPATNYDNYQNK